MSIAFQAIPLNLVMRASAALLVDAPTLDIVVPTIAANGARASIAVVSKSAARICGVIAFLVRTGCWHVPNEF